MTTKRPLLLILAWCASVATMLHAGAADAQISATSQQVTLTCTSSPCPFGPSLNGQAVAWPDSVGASSTRLGYTASKPVYLPAGVANGTTIQITSGTASILAGFPNSTTHRQLAVIASGGTFEITGVVNGEMVAVQGTSSFSYVLTLTTPTPPSGTTSELVIGTCTGSPCPWGSQISGHSLVWPTSAQALAWRLGYSAGKAIYLPANRANGAIVWIDSGSATFFAGRPTDATHRVLATKSVGEFYTVTGLAADEVLAVQSLAPFTYEIDLPEPPPEEPGVLATAVKAYWRCNTPGCTASDWVGAAIGWPSHTAYSSNGRSGSQSRTVYTESGEELYTYMGSWANGCDVTVESGLALIVEWQRGTNSWRETLIAPGQRHVIRLFSPENGAQIEALENSTLLLRSCTSQPLP